MIPPAQSIPSDYGEAYPNSRKVWADGPRRVRVPMREISLSGGEPPLRVYDTSGPLGADVRDGLPKLRREWTLARGDVVPTGTSVLAAASDAIIIDSTNLSIEEVMAYVRQLLQRWAQTRHPH